METCTTYDSHAFYCPPRKKNEVGMAVADYSLEGHDVESSYYHDCDKGDSPCATSATSYVCNPSKRSKELSLGSSYYDSDMESVCHSSATTCNQIKEETALLESCSYNSDGEGLPCPSACTDYNIKQIRQGTVELESSYYD